MQFPTLYHRSKTGKTVEWKVWTKGPEIHVEWGEIGGKKQTTYTTATTKNVGKKNEIEPKKQAEIEARAMWQHRVDRKYSETIKEAQETVFLPMLAHEFEKKKHKLKYPVDVQPKLDGNRAMAYWDNDEVVLMSRGGKTWNVPHISEAIAKFLPKGLVLDGEIYKHGLNLQGINRLVKKHREGPDGSISLKFYAFDVLDPEKDQPWSERCELLHNIMPDQDPDDTNNYGYPVPEKVIVRIVPTWSVKDEKAILDLCTSLVEAGYEGAIVRNKDGLYCLGERSSDLLKVKNFQDDEFEIVGHYLGEGKHEGTVGWWCVTKDGKRFKCYPRGTMEERRIPNPEDFYGEKLKIRFIYYSDDGIPQLPIGICIRLSEDISK